MKRLKGLLHNSLLKLLVVVLLIALIPSSAVNGATWVQNMGSFVASIIPTASNTYDLGSNTLRWRTLYSNNISVNGTAITGNGTSITVAGISVPTGRGATYVIAASDAPVKVKMQADIICDGTDDGADFVTVYNLLPVDGGHIMASTGTFYWGATNLTILKDGIRISGQNSGEKDAAGLEAIGTRFLSTTANPVVVIGVTGANITNEITIDHIFFDGNAAAPIGTVGIEIKNGMDIFLNQVVLRNFTNAGILGDPSGAGDYVAGVYADRIICTGVKFIPVTNGNGVLWAVYFEQSWLNVVEIGDNTHRFATQKDIRISDTWMERIFVYGLSGTDIYSQIALSNCTVESTANSNMVHFDNVRNGSIDRITILNTSAVPYNDKVAISLSSCRDISITNFQISSIVTDNVAALSTGILVYQGQGVSIGDGSIWNLCGTGIGLYTSQMCAISGVKIHEVGQGPWGGWGINVYGNSHDNIIADNTIYDNATTKIVYGIQFGAAGDTTNKVHDNILYNATTANISDAGTRNFIQRNNNYVTENSGTGTINAGLWGVAITHGLVTTPTRIQLTFSNNCTSNIYSSAVGAVTFSANLTAIQGSNVTFDWRAIIGEGN